MGYAIQQVSVPSSAPHGTPAPPPPVCLALQTPSLFSGPFNICLRPHLSWSATEGGAFTLCFSVTPSFAKTATCLLYFLHIFFVTVVVNLVGSAEPHGQWRKRDSREGAFRISNALGSLGVVLAPIYAGYATACKLHACIPRAPCS